MIHIIFYQIPYKYNEGIKKYVYLCIYLLPLQVIATVIENERLYLTLNLQPTNMRVVGKHVAQIHIHSRGSTAVFSIILSFPQYIFAALRLKLFAVIANPKSFVCFMKITSFYSVYT